MAFVALEENTPIVVFGEVNLSTLRQALQKTNEGEAVYRRIVIQKPWSCWEAKIWFDGAGDDARVLHVARNGQAFLQQHQNR